MKRPLFRISKNGSEKKSLKPPSFLTNSILKDICNKITGQTNFDVIWENTNFKGRLITLETDTGINYINLSQTGHLSARNWQVQSIPTALSMFLKAQSTSTKKCCFYFYFLPFTGNNNTPYVNFFYRCMKTMGVKLLNEKFGLKSAGPVKPFASVDDIINARNASRQINSGNQSTYLTDEGDCYHIYGKTFGANQKETTLLCYSLAAITTKPIKLFQVLDNRSQRISDNDVQAIQQYVTNNSTKPFSIMSGTTVFSAKTGLAKKGDLRVYQPDFIYNLLCKHSGKKVCALCGCEIGGIVQGAHIYEVNALRKRKDLTDAQKKSIYTDKDNGIWLCQNHHKLFDLGVITFDNGNLKVVKKLKPSETIFLKKITTITAIKPFYLNNRMLAFFDMRANLKPRVAVY